MRGLIAEIEDGDELASVIAHETGHVVHRDPARQLIRQLGLGGPGAALGWRGADPGRIGGMLLGLSYGRAAKSAAGASAIQALQGAGLRADGLARFFARLERTAPGTIAFLSDHPATAARRTLVAQPPKNAPAFTPSEWASVRTMCAP